MSRLHGRARFQSADEQSTASLADDPRKLKIREMLSIMERADNLFSEKDLGVSGSSRKIRKANLVSNLLQATEQIRLEEQ